MGDATRQQIGKSVRPGDGHFDTRGSPISASKVDSFAVEMGKVGRGAELTVRWYDAYHALRTPPDRATIRLTLL